MQRLPLKHTLQGWLLGHDPKQQRFMALTASAMGVYAVCIFNQWFWVLHGFVPAHRAAALTALMVCGQVVFYGLLRSGWSSRFKDRSLSMPQMLFAIVCLALAYAINPAIRGAALMVAALVLVFGAFTLTPRQNRRMGWFALAIFAAMMAHGALRQPEVFTPVVELVMFLFSFATLPLIGHLAGRLSQMRLHLRDQQRELREALDRVQLLARRDQLTDLPNRRHLEDWLEHELPRMRRNSTPMCLAMLDLDHFKQVNDRLGHPTGDRVLINFATQARSLLRSTDTLVRWGGEEFLLVLPDTPLSMGELVLQRLHDHMRRPDSWLPCPEGQVSFSSGLVAHHVARDFAASLALADAAVYEAKRQGRDRNIVAVEPEALCVSPCAALSASPCASPSA